MKSSSSKLKLAGLALVAAVTVALMSVHVERTGPDLVEYGNLCGPSASDPCYKPQLKGGFPVAYLYDAPGVSRERQLAFVEDKMHVGALIADVTVYFAIMMLIAWAASQRSMVKPGR
jgi:hypothetical protein